MDAINNNDLNENGEYPQNQSSEGKKKSTSDEQNDVQEYPVNQIENNEELDNNKNEQQAILDFHENNNIQQNMQQLIHQNNDISQSGREDVNIDDRDSNQMISNEQESNFQDNQDYNQIDDQNEDQNENDQNNNNNNNSNPAQNYTRMISSMNNEPFLNEETLIGIYELLHLNTTEMFDEIDRNQNNWQQQIEAILKRRLEIYNKKVELISTIYQQNIPNNSMHNIEKIMSIIKSKEKEIYIYKIEKPMACCHHNHNHNHSNPTQVQQDEQNFHQHIQEENEDDALLQQRFIKKQNDPQNSQIQEHQKNTFDEMNNFQSNIENKDQHQQSSSYIDQTNRDFQEENQKQIQNQDQQNTQSELKQEEIYEDQNENISEENLEELQQRLKKTEEIRQKQEEQKRKLIEENQRLKNEYESIIERNQKLKREYEEQVKVENYLLRKEAVAQLQKLAEQSQLQQESQEQIKLEQSTERDQPLQGENQYPLSEENQQKQNLQEQSNDEEIQAKFNKQSIHFENGQSLQQESINPQLNQNEENNDEEQCKIHQERINHEQQQQVNHHQNHHHHNNGEQCDQQHTSSELPGQNFSINDIQSIMQMQFVDLQHLKKLNPVENSITFEMNNNYLIKIRSCEQVKYDKSSFCSQIPHFIFKDHIFPFLSSVELFRVRSVSPEWREMVREVWHKTFKRDMQEQLLATDLCKEIEAQFKLMHIRNPFFQKLNILIRAMVEVINWQDFEKKCLEGQLNKAEKKVVVALLRILGHNQFDYEHINQFEDSEFERHSVDIALHMKDFLNSSINHNGLSSQELKYLYSNFLSQADISISMFRNETDKNVIIFILLAKQYFIYSLLRNYITCASAYMQFAKHKLDALSRDWPSSKGFLEGAYRILLLRNVSIKNGQIVNNDSDEGNESQRLLQKTKRSLRTKQETYQKQNKQSQDSKEYHKEGDQIDLQKKQQNSEEQSQKQQSKDQYHKAEQQNNEQQINETHQDIKEDNKQISSEIKKNNSDNLSHLEQTTLNQKIEVQDQIEKENQQNEEQEQDEENQEDQVPQQEECQDEEEQSQTELSQLMRSIFNFQKQDSQEPDIVIKRKSGLMKIFLDQGTKLDIILNTVLSVGMQRAKIDEEQEGIEQMEHSKQTLDKAEQQLSENPQSIEEIRQKNKDQEECILQKQSELNEIVQRNQELNQELQKEIQELQYIQDDIEQCVEEFNQLDVEENENKDTQNENNN